jgi:hypothetical protein
VLLFVGLLGLMLVPGAGVQKGVPETLEAVWLTLDPKDGESFGQKVDAAVQQGQVKAQASDMLQFAFGELAVHRTRTEGVEVKCYRMTKFAGELVHVRESAYKQLELLRKARKAGTIDEETAQKCQAVLGKELEMLSQARQLVPGDSGAERRLLDEYSRGELKPGEAATETAAFIVRMETGQVAAGERSE